ncbi:MAG: ABC transporter permease [Actinomycetota bacterium]
MGSGSASHGRRAAWWLTTVASIVAGLFAAPFLYLLIRNLSEGGSLWSFLTTGRAIGPLLRSVVLATAVAAAAATVGTAAAWLVTRTDLPGKHLWRVLLPLPLVIPSFIGAFVLLAAFAPGGLLEAALQPLGVQRLHSVHGFWGSFIVLTLFTYPYVYLPTAARLRQLPSSLEESARLLGRAPAAVFRTVVLPQCRAAILAGTLLVFLYSVSDFGVVQLMRYDTLTRVIYSTRLIDRVTSLTLSLQLGVLALAVVAAERAVTSGARALRGPRGTRPLRVGLGRWKSAALGGMALLLALALAAPVGVMAWWATRGVLRGTAGGGASYAGLGGLAGPAVNTSFVSVAGAILAVLLVLPVAYLTVRYRSRVGDVANAVIVGGFALPGLAIALALVVWTVGGPGILGALYQSLPLLVLAYVIHFGAQSMRTAQVALAGVPPGVEDAAKTLGAGRVRRLMSVELPLMVPGLLAGGGLVLLSVMKELPATLLLAPTGFQTLATKIWQATQSAFFADASIAALVLITLSGVLTWLLVIRRGDTLV